MASIKSKFLWENGIRLQDAWKAFAPDRILQKLNSTPSFFDVFSNAKKAGNWIELLETFNSAFEASQLGKQLENEAKEHLLIELFNDQLMATGYQELPRRGQKPVRIDPDAFDLNEPDWEFETIEALGLKHNRLRITDHFKFKSQVAANSKASGTKLEIENAIGQLLAEGIDPVKLPHKTSYNLILAKLNAEYIPGNGLSPANVAKAIVRQCGKKAFNN